MSDSTYMNGYLEDNLYKAEPVYDVAERNGISLVADELHNAERRQALVDGFHQSMVAYMEESTPERAQQTRELKEVAQQITLALEDEIDVDDENTVQIDYVSDLHLSRYIPWVTDLDELQKHILLYLDSHVFPVEQRGEWVIVAGDIDDNLFYIQVCLGYLSSVYKKVFLVFGYHEMALRTEFDRERYDLASTNKKDAIRSFAESLGNLYVLDNEFTSCEGILIAGSTFSYPLTTRSDIVHYNQKSEEIHSIYPNGVKAVNDRFLADSLFVKYLGSGLDILITHVPPKYLGVGAGDTEHLMSNPSEIGCVPKYWITGRQHYNACEDFKGSTLVANPWGYPEDATERVVKSIYLKRRL